MAPASTAADGTEKRKRRVKRKKDPNAPKAALTPFMLFSQEQRPSVKDANPTATFGELGRLIGEKWRALSEEGKQPYVKKSAKDKERYEQEKLAYQKTKA